VRAARLQRVSMPTACGVRARAGRGAGAGAGAEGRGKVRPPVKGRGSDRRDNPEGDGLPAASRQAEVRGAADSVEAAALSPGSRVKNKVGQRVAQSARATVRGRAAVLSGHVAVAGQGARPEPLAADQVTGRAAGTPALRTAGPTETLGSAAPVAKAGRARVFAATLA